MDKVCTLCTVATGFAYTVDLGLVHTVGTLVKTFVHFFYFSVDLSEVEKLMVTIRA